MGLLDGVTTSPSPVAKAGRKLESLIGERCEITWWPVWAKVTTVEAGTMVEDAHRARTIVDNVEVSCPRFRTG